MNTIWWGRLGDNSRFEPTKSLRTKTTPSVRKVYANMRREPVDPSGLARQVSDQIRLSNSASVSLLRALVAPDSPSPSEAKPHLESCRLL